MTITEIGTAAQELVDKAFADAMDSGRQLSALLVPAIARFGVECSGGIDAGLEEAASCKCTKTLEAMWIDERNGVQYLNRRVALANLRSLVPVSSIVGLIENKQ